MVKNIKPINWLRKPKKNTRRANILEARKLKTADENISYYGVKSITDKKAIEDFKKSKRGQEYLNKGKKTTATTKKRGRPKGSKNKKTKKTELEKAIDPIVEPVREVVKPILEPVIETAEDLLEPVVEVAQTTIPTLIEDEKEEEKEELPRKRGRPKKTDYEKALMKEQARLYSLYEQAEKEAFNEAYDEYKNYKKSKPEKERRQRKEIINWLKEMKTKKYDEIEEEDLELIDGLIGLDEFENKELDQFEYLDELL